MRQRGIVIAITGPDGAGKTTQIARLATQLGESFRCRTLYLGSNQGGVGVRRSVGRLREARAGRAKEAGTARGWLHVTGSSLWRLAVAARRYQSVVAAKRMAAIGFIVITDRWPQNAQPGMMDGPSLPPPRRRRIARALSWLERQIYGRMERYRPELMIQILCDYATSRLHKPGDLDEPKFDQRMALLEKMRRSDPDILAVDGRHSADEVTVLLLDKIRPALRDLCVSTIQRSRRTPVLGAGIMVEER